MLLLLLSSIPAPANPPAFVKDSKQESPPLVLLQFNSGCFFFFFLLLVNILSSTSIFRHEIFPLVFFLTCSIKIITTTATFSSSFYLFSSNIYTYQLPLHLAFVDNKQTQTYMQGYRSSVGGSSCNVYVMSSSSLFRPPAKAANWAHMHTRYMPYAICYIPVDSYIHKKEHINQFRK